MAAGIPEISIYVDNFVRSERVEISLSADAKGEEITGLVIDRLREHGLTQTWDLDREIPEISLRGRVLDQTEGASLADLGIREGITLQYRSVMAPREHLPWPFGKNPWKG